MNIKKLKIAVIGLGYVGLPLSVELGKKVDTIGYDINRQRIIDLQKGFDKTLEVENRQIKLSYQLKFSNNENDLLDRNIYIIAVPTPINKNNEPKLKLLIDATKLVGKFVKKKDIIIFESTVYPGMTEEVCVPILSKQSKLLYNKDFFCGYSPERINPGDKKRTITKIKKITSGSNPKTATIVDKIYKLIIKAGTHKTSSIRIAEAAKVIENTQRDVNIALVNELAMLFKRLNIDTEEVLKAAETKWNFISFKPGLVGGHCIGVDPYYLTYKAQKVNFKTKMILSGRSINDNMPRYISREIINLMKKKNINISNSKILILGLAFKENSNDLRNTKIIDLVNLLKKKSCKIYSYDPLVDRKIAEDEYGISIISNLNYTKYFDCIVLAVNHNKFKSLKINKLNKIAKKNSVLYDIKYMLRKKEVDGRL